MVEAHLQHWRSEASACAPPSAAPSRELPPVAAAHSAGLDAAGAATAAPLAAAPGREPPCLGPDLSRGCTAAVPPVALDRARVLMGAPEVLGPRSDTLADPLGAGSLEEVVDRGEGCHEGRGRGTSIVERGAFARSTYAQRGRPAAVQPQGGGAGPGAGRPASGGPPGGNPLDGCMTRGTGCAAGEAAGGGVMGGRPGASGGAGAQPGPAPATSHAGLSAGGCGAGAAPPAWPARLPVSPFALQAAQLQRSSSD